MWKILTLVVPSDFTALSRIQNLSPLPIKSKLYNLVWIFSGRGETHSEISQIPLPEEYPYSLSLALPNPPIWGVSLLSLSLPIPTTGRVSSPKSPYFRGRGIPTLSLSQITIPEWYPYSISLPNPPTVGVSLLSPKSPHWWGIPILPLSQISLLSLFLPLSSLFLFLFVPNLPTRVVFLLQISTARFPRLLQSQMDCRRGKEPVFGTWELCEQPSLFQSYAVYLTFQEPLQIINEWSEPTEKGGYMIGIKRWKKPTAFSVKSNIIMAA